MILTGSLQLKMELVIFGKHDLLQQLLMLRLIA